MPEQDKSFLTILTSEVPSSPTGSGWQSQIPTPSSVLLVVPKFGETEESLLTGSPHLGMSGGLTQYRVRQAAELEVGPSDRSGFRSQVGPFLDCLSSGQTA